MFRKYIILGLFVAAGVVLAGISCTKSTTVVINPGSQITRQVSFSKDVIPLFAKSCALSGCHASGGHAPDLSAVNAYGSLTTGGYVKAGDPDNSVVMLWLTGKKTPQMPLGNAPDEDVIADVYAWIEQGALNN